MCVFIFPKAFFHVTSGLPPDIMHDMLEGAHSPCGNKVSTDKANPGTKDFPLLSAELLNFIISFC